MRSCANVGTTDRIIRIVAGVVALVLGVAVFGLLQGEVGGFVAAAVGLVLLATAIVRVCPAYMPLGVSTCKNGSN